MTITISGDKVTIKPDINERLLVEEASNGDIIISSSKKLK